MAGWLPLVASAVFHALVRHASLSRQPLPFFSAFQLLGTKRAKPVPSKFSTIHSRLASSVAACYPSIPTTWAGKSKTHVGRLQLFPRDSKLSSEAVRASLSAFGGPASRLLLRTARPRPSSLRDKCQRHEESQPLPRTPSQELRSLHETNVSASRRIVLQLSF